MSSPLPKESVTFTREIKGTHEVVLKGDSDSNRKKRIKHKKTLVCSKSRTYQKIKEKSKAYQKGSKPSTPVFPAQGVLARSWSLMPTARSEKRLLPDDLLCQRKLGTGRTGSPHTILFRRFFNHSKGGFMKSGVKNGVKSAEPVGQILRR